MLERERGVLDEPAHRVLLAEHLPNGAAGCLACSRQLHRGVLPNAVRVCGAQRGPRPRQLIHDKLRRLARALVLALGFRSLIERQIGHRSPDLLATAAPAVGTVNDGSTSCICIDPVSRHVCPGERLPLVVLPAMSSRPAVSQTMNPGQGLQLHSLPSVVVFAAQASSEEVIQPAKTADPASLATPSRLQHGHPASLSARLLQKSKKT